MAVSGVGSEDVDTAFVHPMAAWGAAGTVLWGDGAQALNRTLCGSGASSLSAWVNNTMGPAVLQASKDADTCAATRCTGHGTCWGANSASGVRCDCDAGWTGASCDSGRAWKPRLMSSDDERAAGLAKR